MSKKEKTEKYLEYAVKIQGAIAEMFNEESETDYKISLDELNQDDNLTHFFHALANIVPCNMYGRMTNNEVNTLDFNHIANQLCFQFSKKID